MSEPRLLAQRGLDRPRPIEMVITPDVHLLGRCDGEISFAGFLGAAEDLVWNIYGAA